MTPTIHWPLGAFDATWRRYLSFTHKRTLPEITNDAMHFILSRAYVESPVTARAMILRDLEVARVELRRSKKTGKVKIKGFRIAGGTDEVPIVFKLVQAARRAQGKLGLYGSKMRSAVRAFINKRLAAVGTLRAGFIVPLQRLAQAAGRPIPFQHSKRVKGRGKALPAQEGWTTYAEFLHVALKAESSPKAQVALAAAVARAFEHERLKMEGWMERRLQQDAIKLGMA